LAAIRWWARRLGDLAYEDALPKEQRDEIATQAARVTAIKDVSGERAPKGRHISAEEFQALLQACQQDDSPAGSRDAALMALAWCTGARRSELTSLKLSDLSLLDQVRQIKIKGKGNKVRRVYLQSEGDAWLKAWLRVRGLDPGPVFCRVRKGGKLQRQGGLSDEGLAQMLAKRCLQAGVDPLTWHDFRRTFAGNLLDGNVDLATVQKLMGHTSPTTTSNYDRRGEDVKIRAVHKLKVPFRPNDESESHKASHKL